MSVSSYNARNMSSYLHPCENGTIRRLSYATASAWCLEPENKYYIFGKDGCKNLAEELNVPLLAQVPLIQSVCETGDKGEPAVLNPASPEGIAFMSLAAKVVTQVDKRNIELEPTHRVEVKRWELTILSNWQSYLIDNWQLIIDNYHAAWWSICAHRVSLIVNCQLSIINWQTVRFSKLAKWH